MKITFDYAKDAANRAKHGVSLELAGDLDWPEVLTYVDARRDYRELREVGFGAIGNRLYCVTFTQRGDTMHVISMRKANKREVKRYVEQA